jgi:hypothetical protein
MRYEEIKQRDPKQTLKHFVQFVARDLDLRDEPEIEFSAKKKNESDHNTGWYSPDTNTIWVYTGNRNLIDILRTVAHELRHRMQGQDDRIDSEGTYPGHPLEQEADAYAGYIVKVYGEKHPHIMQ